MSRGFVFYITNLIRRFDSLIPTIFPHRGALAVAALPSTSSGRYNQDVQRSQRSLKDIIGDGILWAVPKHRRTVEKRLNRKFGYPMYNWKPLVVKTHLRNCTQCGHDYEAGLLCTYCYRKVQEETTEMQNQIQKELNLDPVEQDVVVLYSGERQQHSAETFNGKRIVEMDKPRPLWFTKNLLQKTTQQPSDSKEVKPTDLA